MKINWGTGIVIAFILFIAFILYFVITVQVNPKYDNELVTPTYYQEEVYVQDNIEKQQNAQALSEKVSIKKTADGIVIQFPSNFQSEKITGKIQLYRPDNQKLDFEIPIMVNHSQMLIPNKNLVTGSWDITADWTYAEKGYRNSQTIYF